MTPNEAAMHQALLDIYRLSTQETSRVAAQIRERASRALDELVACEEKSMPS